MADLASMGDDTPNSFGPRRSSRAKRNKQRSISVPGLSDTLPAFLRKTYFMLEHPEEFGDSIKWSEDGKTLVVDKVAQFSTTVLPQFFKHSNYASFVRQLNMYGFHKTSPDPACRQFRHGMFLRGRPDLVPGIKRKTSGAAKPKEGPLAPPAPSAADLPPAPISIPVTSAPQLAPATASAPMPVPRQVAMDAAKQAASTRGFGTGGMPPMDVPPALMSALATPAMTGARQGVDGMLTELVRLRASHQTLSSQVAALQADAAVSAANSAALAEELRTSQGRQAAGQRRLERLMMFTYELYRSMWGMHHSGQLEGGAASPRIAPSPGGMREAGEAGVAPSSLHDLFFSSTGLVPPAKFVQMLDYVDMPSSRFTQGPAALGDRAEVLRIQGTVAPPQLVSVEARGMQDSHGTGVGLHPSKRQALEGAGGPVPAMASLWRAGGMVTPTSLPPMSVASMSGGDGLPLLGDSPPMLGGSKRARPDDGLSGDAAQLQAAAAGQHHGQTLADLISHSEALSDAEHSLLGQLAETDHLLATEFPEAHADVSSALGHGMGQASLDMMDNLELVDLDDESSSLSGSAGL